MLGRSTSLVSPLNEPTLPPSPVAPESVFPLTWMDKSGPGCSPWGGPPKSGWFARSLPTGPPSGSGSGRPDPPDPDPEPDPEPDESPAGFAQGGMGGFAQMPGSGLGSGGLQTGHLTFGTRPVGS